MQGTQRRADHFSVSGRALLTSGLLLTFVGNLMYRQMAREQFPYQIFIVAMIVAGCGAGILNGQTVKVLGSAVPADRAGMASGLASTTRFIGILVSVAGLGALLAHVVSATFLRSARAAGLDGAAADAAAKLMTSGNILQMLGQVPPDTREVLHAASLSSFAHGFAAASLVAAIVALVAAGLTFVLISPVDTAPSSPLEKRHCKFVDCRDPL